jgi:hypothetical protein
MWPLGLVAFLLSWPVVRSLAVRLTRGRFRTQALGTQPDRIFLVRSTQPQWRQEQLRDYAARQLSTSGFVNAGTFQVREMPELTLGLYANVQENAYAMLYDHPRSGFWAEFVTRYEDGTIAHFTTLEPMDVEVPKGSLHVAAPHLTLGDLWKTMLAERPSKPMVPCSPFTAASDFEKGYAESMAYHKTQTTIPAIETTVDEEDLRQAA